jgi:xanthine/uracil/vitamin C permease (AzgA family)
VSRSYLSNLKLLEHNIVFNLCVPRPSGGAIGVNSVTCCVESNTGVEAGARTGLASIATGSSFFLLSLLFVQPFVNIISDAAP